MKYIITENKLHSNVLSFIDNQLGDLTHKTVALGRITNYKDQYGEIIFTIVNKYGTINRLTVNRDFVTTVHNMFQGVINLPTTLELIVQSFEKKYPHIKFQDATVE